MKFISIFLMFFLTGCVSMMRGTVHQYCSSHSEKYANYDECYKEEASYRQNLRNTLSHTGDGLQRNRNDKDD